MESKEPVIITKKFLLAGVEMKLDLKSNFPDPPETLLPELKRNLHKIVNAVQPIRPVGLWTGDPDVDYSNPANRSKRVYFFGVEIRNNDEELSNIIIRDFPESLFAVFREEQHGTAPKWKWLETSGYVFNHEAVPGDMEIYDDFDHLYHLGGSSWDILIPIRKP